MATLMIGFITDVSRDISNAHRFIPCRLGMANSTWFCARRFEHLKEPVSALREIKRVLKPSGLVALRSPDWGGFIIAPDTPGLSAAIKRYVDIQTHNCGDVQVGRKFPGLLRAAGIEFEAFSASYEYYVPVTTIGEYLALH